ncbi:oxidoreductase [Mycolicibacterium canariasense]|uniref:Oxidoreductase n=1 Tax=Mycolicibacterium canariasense TaxID=228230 RepID=A0A100WK91_MYCCR|nr:FAD-binding oxidoreductase [Mycolicibacterium canariasense]MCV7207619.1 FAD-binding oxidoreductase [Mycolicibacterium canariasense]ORV08840.1 oxidoreductase [Mycolicibacterium canariasense]GAS99731.1 oxidoreductase [Mycolicibacterium canariasense]
MAALDTARYFVRGADGYEAARRATVWNARLPQRFPDLIVQAADVADVVAAVRHAAERDLTIGIRSGGHSWAANHVRDGGLLLDVSRLDSCRVDTTAMTAVVGPGKGGSALAVELAEQGLFFPAGHCRGVAIGGYLLQGGYGWNSRVLGPACESVLGLDVVTADGAQVYCDSEHHPELYWAARGSGPGFFGVVTAFHLRLYPKPPVCGSSLYVYPIESADAVFGWAREISAEVDRRVELQIVTSTEIPGVGLRTPGIVLASPVFADTEDQAKAALALLDSCPARADALIAVPFAPADLPSWFDAVMSNYPSGHRYATDNMWTSAPAADLVPGVRRIIETMPPHPSHFLWLNWGPSPARQDMAYSLEDEIYLALYTAWSDPADDARYGDWARSNMAEMAHLATGVQLADENLGERPARFATDASMARLDAVRAQYDPHCRFHSWMGRV